MTFLHGRELADKIREVLRGKDVTCAVAFVGDIHKATGIDDTRDWKIVCDISMGGTSRLALKRLGAPENENARFLDGLHAKIYASDAGVVVCSANASFRALGTPDAEPRHFEAGVFLARGSREADEARDRAETFFEEAQQIDSLALIRASENFRQRHPADENLELGPFLSSIVLSPAFYAAQEIGFVLCGQITAEAARAETERVAELNPADRNTLMRYGLRDTFVGWSEINVNLLRDHFVCFSLGTRHGLHVTQHIVDRRFPAEDAFYTRSPERDMRDPRGNVIRGQSLTENDRILLRRILEGIGDDGLILSAAELSELIQEAARGL